LPPLADLFVLRGVLVHIRSDQGPEFIAEAVKGWIGRLRSTRAKKNSIDGPC
jgi:putative transposase